MANAKVTTKGLVRRFKNRRVSVYAPIVPGDDWLIRFVRLAPVAPGVPKRAGRFVVPLKLSNEAAMAMVGMIAALAQREGPLA